MGAADVLLRLDDEHLAQLGRVGVVVAHLRDDWLRCSVVVRGEDLVRVRLGLREQLFHCHLRDAQLLCLWIHAQTLLALRLQEAFSKALVLLAALHAELARYLGLQTVS